MKKNKSKTKTTVAAKRKSATANSRIDFGTIKEVPVKRIKDNIQEEFLTLQYY